MAGCEFTRSRESYCEDDCAFGRRDSHDIHVESLAGLAHRDISFVDMLEYISTMALCQGAF